MMLDVVKTEKKKNGGKQNFLFFILFILFRSDEKKQIGI